MADLWTAELWMTHKLTARNLNKKQGSSFPELFICSKRFQWRPGNYN